MGALVRPLVAGWRRRCVAVALMASHRWRSMARALESPTSSWTLAWTPSCAPSWSDSRAAWTWTPSPYAGTRWDAPAVNVNLKSHTLEVLTMMRPDCSPITILFQYTPTSKEYTDDKIRIGPTNDPYLYAVQYYDAHSKSSQVFTLSKPDVFEYLSTVFRSLWPDDQPYSGVQVMLPGAPSNLFHARMDSATRDLIYDGIAMTMRSWPRSV